MKTTARVGLVLTLVGLMVALSFPSLTGADGGGANVIRGFDCTISLAELKEGAHVTTTDTQSVETPSGNVMLRCRADLPDDVGPPARAVRTTGEQCDTPQGRTTDTEKVITPGGRVRLTCRIKRKPPPPATGWAVGVSVGDGYGVIIHTTDGGETWVRQGEAGGIPDVDLVKVAAIDAQNAWVTGDHGTILRTRNGGRTWERQAVPAEVSDTTLWGVYALDRKTAWVTGYQGTILHTTDGGRTWIRKGQGKVPSGAQVTGVYASDVDHAWVVSGDPPLILHTTDGGANWQTTPNPCEICDWLIWPHGVDDNTVWIGANGAVIHTADGGQTWDVQLEGGYGDFNCVFAVDRETIWAIFDPDYAYRSTDGGENWPPARIPTQKLTHISAVDRQTAWTVGVGEARPHKVPGQVLFTAHGNQTWTVQTTPVQTDWWGVSFVR